MPVPPIPSPYLAFSRAEWAHLRDNHPMSLTAEEVARMRGLGDRVDVREVEEVYLPLSRLLTFYVQAVRGLHQVTGAFLGERGVKMPFVIGVAGSVAVGKSTTSRILQELLLRWPGTPRVSLVTTDGFLYPNAELQRRGLLQRKGFPESYDRHSLMNFIASVKSGMDVVKVPVYSHLTYDIVPGETIEVRRPDVLIVEGLNVLQPPVIRADGTRTGAISDYFDFSVYVDAEKELIKTWYIERFLRLREVAFADPQSYFHRYATLTDSEARKTADGIWSRINEPNLVQNVAPTQDRATLILTKSADHSVSRILLRKL